jgi:serine/threonine protein kinase
LSVSLTVCSLSLSSFFFFRSNICPTNIVFVNPFADSPIKLVDFGCAVEAEGHCIDELVGSPAYLAPEIIEGKPYG